MLDQRKRAGVAVAVALLAALSVWLYGRSRTDHTDAHHDDGPAAIKQTSAQRRAADPAEVVVLVSEQGGATLAGALVVARAKNREPVVERTDRAGTARLLDLASDEWTITASASGHLASSSKIALAPSARERVVLQLAAGGASLRGTITDGQGPVGGARVDAARLTRGITFSDDVTASATTDDQGRYQLVVAVAGYYVEATHPAYAPIGRRIDVPATGALGDFTLLPGGAIEGRVVDREDKPVPNAVVVATGGSNDAHVVLASADGRFRIGGLPPATIELDASAPGWLADDPVEVRLAVGEEVSDVVLRVHHVPRVSGVVVDVRGAPAPATRVDLLGAQYRVIEHVTSARDGTFVFEAVAPGAYQVISAPPGWTTGATQVEVRDADIPDVRVVRSAAPVVRGRVTPPQAAEVWLQPIPGGPPIHLETPTQTGADGTFELTPTDVGKMRVAARTLAGTQGAADIEVTMAGTEVVVLLRTGGVITGRVVDAASTPVPSVAVMALPIGASRLTTIVRGGITDGRQAPTGTDGTFRLDGLQAAQYELRVFDQGHPLTSPDGKPVSVEVVLADAESRSVTLTVGAAIGVIKGVVRGADGKPVADAWVRAVQRPWDIYNEMQDGAIHARDLSGASSSGISFDARDGDQLGMANPALTTANGAFELRGLRPAVEVQLIAEAEGGTLRGRAKARPNADVTITIGATASLTGTVVLGGAPLASFEVDLSGPSSVTRTFDNLKGQFALPRLEAGTYSIEVSASQGDASKSGVRIEPGGTANVELVLVPYGKIVGSLVDERQRPVAGVQLNPNVLEGGASRLGLRGPIPISGADGHFEITVVPGKIRVLVQAKGRHASAPEATVAPGATVDVGAIVVSDKPSRQK